MNYKQKLISTLLVVALSINCRAQDSEQEILKVVNAFFISMETKDSRAFNNLFLENAYAYSVRQKEDSTIVRSSILKPSSSKLTLKERLREEEITIQVNRNIASVWAPYDFWVNDKHSHCGYEVFTLIRKDKSWKIASLTYSIEKDTCNK